MATFRAGGDMFIFVSLQTFPKDAAFWDAFSWVSRGTTFRRAKYVPITIFLFFLRAGQSTRRIKPDRGEEVVGMEYIQLYRGQGLA